MSTSNRKPAGKSEAPQEPFKRAVAGCMRAMSGTRELEVTFAAERPSLIGSGESAKARLPEPARKLTPGEAAIVRGHADSLALKLACHDNTRLTECAEHLLSNQSAHLFTAHFANSFNLNLLVCIPI